jgi:hypothetical protein
MEVDAFIPAELPAVSNNWAVFTNWITLEGGIPHGTRISPCIFQILIDDLKTIMAAFKYVDVTVAKIIDQSNISQRRPNC